MPIRYFLLDNKMTPAEGKQRAQVASRGTITMKDIIDRAMDRGTSVTRTDMVAVMELFHDVAIDFAAQGYTVLTPLCNVRAGVRGMFADSDAIFKKGEHELRPAVSPGLGLKKKFKTVKAEKVDGGRNKPCLDHLSDTESDTRDTEITPGGMARLCGSRLSFVANDPLEGIFLKPAGAAAIRVTKYSRSKPSEIIFRIPEGLAPGLYTLSVRSHLGTKTLREGQLQGDLEIK